MSTVSPRLPPAFAPPETFRPTPRGPRLPSGPYQLLPFRFCRLDPDRVLVINDAGDFAMLEPAIFQALVDYRLDREHPDFGVLVAKQMITEGDLRVPLELLATRYRTRKSFLEGFTRLHLFVVTLRCDHSCRYCQVSRVSADRRRFDMDFETARRALDLVFESPASRLKIELQGGEPLLAFDVVRFLVLEAEKRAAAQGRQVDFVIATNLVPITDQILSFLAEHKVCVSTSLDGPAPLHNANRPRPGRDSHALLEKNLQAVRGALGQDRVAAVMTTTERSLEHPEAIVDEYVRLGFDSIFLRPISPYGFAVRTGEAGRYESEAFLSFYTRALDHILELNRRGVELVEVYAQILLTRMLTPFATGYVDLQSPAGTVLGAVAYNYDGDVYASDEARMLAAMGDTAFRLGNVHRDSYRKIFGGPLAWGLARGSVLEALPGCSQCAFLPWCGADPVYHYRTQGDPIGHKAQSGFCRKNMGLLRHLLKRFMDHDAIEREILLRWVTGAQAPPAAEAAS